MTAAIPDFQYIPTATGLKFHDSDAKIKLVFGPYGSGKTCMIMNDAKFYALAQAPAPDGVRYTKIGVVRGTYPELISATRQSILEVFPSQFGTVRQGGAPIMGLYRFPVGDGPYDWISEGRPWEPGFGTFAQVEFNLIALQNADDVEKIKSTNWSFAIINEATSVDFEVINGVLGRVGRYPSEAMGGCSYSGILIDSNQPPHGHYLLAMKANPEPNWEIFEQPPAAFKKEDAFGSIEYEVNPNAENLRNLGGAKKPDDFYDWPVEDQEAFLHEKGMAYYQDQISLWRMDGRTDKIDSLFCMLDVPVMDGKPVWTSFKYDLHVAREEIKPIAGAPVIIGFDTSGIHPAAVFVQQLQQHWCIVDELYGDEMGLQAFIEQALLPVLASRYAGSDVVVVCDLANARDNYTGLAPTAHLEAHGLRAVLSKTNNPKTRIQAVEKLLNQVTGGLLVSPHCSMMIQAFQGGYRYERLRVRGAIGAVYDIKPDKKSVFSHIADALQYAALYINREQTGMDRDISGMLRSLERRRNLLRRIM